MPMELFMNEPYDVWFSSVKTALLSINMPLEEWQEQWPFDFSREYESGVPAADAAEKANRHWWFHQNRALNQHCDKTHDCWLPRGHQGTCHVK